MRKVAPAEAASVLQSVFSRYLTEMGQCPDQDFTLEEARNAGAIVPSVSSRLEGALTSPQARERLYLVAAGECGASHADNYGTRVLALFRGDALAATIPVEETSMARALDVDGDGRLEIALETGWTQMGITEARLTLYRVNDDSLHLIRAFDQVYEGHCGTGEPNAMESYSVIAVRTKAEGSPEFEVARDTKPCD